MAEVGVVTAAVMPEAKGFGKALEDQVKPQTESVASKIGGLFGTAFKAAGAAVIGASAVVAAGVGAIVTAGVKYNAAMETYDAGFTTLLGSADKAESLLGELSSFAAKTPFEMPALADASQTLLSFGIDSQTVMSDLQMLGDISMGNSEKLSGLSVVFGQVASQGRLMGQDVLQMISNGFNPLQIISDKTGESMVDLKKRMEQGGISFEEVRAAMESATSEGGMFFGAMENGSKTLTGQLSTLSDGFNILSGAMVGQLSAGLTNDVLPGINGVVGGLIDLVNGVDGAQGAIDESSAQLVAGLESFGPAIESLAGNLGTVFDALAPALQTALGTLVNSLSTLLPSILTLAGSLIQALVQGIVQNAPTLAATAIPLILGLVSMLLGQLPAIVEAGMQVIIALVLGIANSLPTLIPQIVLVVVQIVQTLIDNLPLLLDAALQLIMGLAEGLIAAIPVLMEALPQILTSIYEFLYGSIPTIIQAGIDLLVSLVAALPEIINSIVAALPQIIEGVVGAIIDGIPQIILAGVELLIALIENLPQIITEVNKAGPQIVDGLVSAFGRLGPQMVKAGKDLIRGLIDGIGRMGSALWNAATDVASQALDGIKSFFGIASPSKLMRDEIGTQIGAGLALGIDQSANKAVKSMLGMKTGILDAAQGIAASTQMRISGMRIDTGSVVEANSWRTPAQTGPVEVSAPGVEGKIDELIDAQKTLRVMERMW